MRSESDGRPRLPGDTVRHFESARINDSCGCAIGATFMVAGLLASSIYCGWQLHARELSLLSAVLRILVATFLAAGAGKITGILLYQHTGKRISPLRLLHPSLNRKGN